MKENKIRTSSTESAPSIAFLTRFFSSPVNLLSANSSPAKIPLKSIPPFPPPPPAPPSSKVPEANSLPRGVNPSCGFDLSEKREREV